MAEHTAAAAAEVLGLAPAEMAEHTAAAAAAVTAAPAGQVVCMAVMAVVITHQVEFWAKTEVYFLALCSTFTH